MQAHETASGYALDAFEQNAPAGGQGRADLENAQLPTGVVQAAQVILRGARVVIPASS